VRREGAKIVLAADPAYFMGKPDLDSLIFTPVRTWRWGGNALLVGRATIASLPSNASRSSAPTAAIGGPVAGSQSLVHRDVHDGAAAQ
jgi:hypothetical protein